MASFAAYRRFPVRVHTSSLLLNKVLSIGVHEMARILIHHSHVICFKYFCASGSEVRIDEVVFLIIVIEKSDQIVGELLTLGGSSYM